MKIDAIKNWIETQKKEIPETAKIELAKTEGFFNGALRTVTVLEAFIAQQEVEEKESKDQKNNK